MEGNKYKKLAKNTILFGISNFGSKLLSFLLVPLYTYILSTEEYGTADLIYVTCTILVSIFSLGISEGTVRFTLSDSYDKNMVFTNSMIITIVMSLAMIPTAWAISMFDVCSNYGITIYFIVVLQMLYGVTSQFTRGNDQVKIFAEAGIIQTFTTLCAKLILLVVFHYKVGGFLISYVIGFGVSTIYTIVRAKIWRYIKFNSYDKAFIREILIYSYPTIFTGLSWWILNSSDKYVITWFLGSGANGVYSISHKIPSIVAVFSSFFNSAWQLSAANEQEGDNDKGFYQRVFGLYAGVTLMGSSALIAVVRYFLPFIISKDYGEAVEYVPLLMIACAFQVFANFYGGFNYAFKKTKNLIFNTVVGAVLNLILNIALTPFMGMYGTAISTVIGCFVVWILRVRYVVREFDVDLDLKNIYISSAIVFGQALLFWWNNVFINIIQFAIIFVIVWLNKKMIGDMISVIRRKIRRV